MADNYYIPIYANMLAEDNLFKLMEDKGAKGLGTFFYLIIELRMRENFKCNVINTKALARKLRVKTEYLEEIIFKSKLFVITKSENEEFFESVYLQSAMKKVKHNKPKTSELESEGKPFAGEAPQEQQSTFSPIGKERKGEERKGDPATSSPTWERFVDAAVSEQSHIERIAMHSGIGLDFITYKDLIVKAFKEHILIQGSQDRIDSQSEASSYFANFTRRGTPTNKRLRELVDQAKAQTQTEDPYRHEQRDPITGKRSYIGLPIPDDAPPRPGEKHMWNTITLEWEFVL